MCFMCSPYVLIIRCALRYIANLPSLQWESFPILNLILVSYIQQMKLNDFINTFLFDILFITCRLKPQSALNTYSGSADFLQTRKITRLVGWHNDRIINRTPFQVGDESKQYSILALTEPSVRLFVNLHLGHLLTFR